MVDELESRRSKSVAKIFQMFLHMKSFKVREILANGLAKTLQGSGLVSDEALTQIKDMNTVKKGLADMELDYDKTLTAIKSVGRTAPETL